MTLRVSLLPPYSRQPNSGTSWTILKVDEIVLWDVGNHTSVYTASHSKGRNVKNSNRLGILQLSLPTWY
jgi:hypothetical protein